MREVELGRFIHEQLISKDYVLYLYIGKQFISPVGRVGDVFQFESYECFICIVKFNSFLS